MILARAVRTVVSMFVTSSASEPVLTISCSLGSGAWPSLPVLPPPPTPGAAGAALAGAEGAAVGAAVGALAGPALIPPAGLPAVPPLPPWSEALLLQAA